MNVGVQIPVTGPRHCCLLNYSAGHTQAEQQHSQASHSLTRSTSLLQSIPGYWIHTAACSMQPAVVARPCSHQPPARCCQCSVLCGPWPCAAQPAGPGKNVSSATKSGDFLPQLSFVSVDQGEYEQA